MKQCNYIKYCGILNSNCDTSVNILKNFKKVSSFHFRKTEVQEESLKKLRRKIKSEHRNLINSKLSSFIARFKYEEDGEACDCHKNVFLKIKTKTHMLYDIDGLERFEQIKHLVEFIEKSKEKKSHKIPWNEFVDFLGQLSDEENEKMNQAFPYKLKNFCLDSKLCQNSSQSVSCFDTNCMLPGYFCGNRNFSKRGPGCMKKVKEGGKIKIENCGKKGKGVITEVPIRKGDFICEYSGEIKLSEELIPEDNPYYYLKSLSDTKETSHTYKMVIAKGVYIDAKNTLNFCKFINHSCDPNCQTEKWFVDSVPKIGIFAIRDIMSGEELTFDYDLDEPGLNPIICRCGSENCTGMIGKHSNKNSKEILVEILGSIWSLDKEEILKNESLVGYLDDLENLGDKLEKVDFNKRFEEMTSDEMKEIVKSINVAVNYPSIEAFVGEKDLYQNEIAEYSKEWTDKMPKEVSSLFVDLLIFQQSREQLENDYLLEFLYRKLFYGDCNCIVDEDEMMEINKVILRNKIRNGRACFTKINIFKNGEVIKQIKKD